MVGCSKGKRVRFRRSGSEQPKKVKTCKFDVLIRCYWSSCDYVDFKGVVRVCGHHPNKLGRFTRRKVSPNEVYLEIAFGCDSCFFSGFCYHVVDSEFA